MRKLFYKILKYFAKQILKKYKPFIIGVTGSVGKSSTKEAIYTVLKNFYRVRRNLKNYNNEIGVPLTILGRMSPGKRIAGWIRVFWMALGSIWFTEKNYPEILILEMAADHPGDIKYLINNFAPCKIGVITAIGPSHLEFFKNIDNIIKEKQILVTTILDGGWAILNQDDENVMKMNDKISAKVLTYGLNEGADVRALEIGLDQELNQEAPQINGLRFKIKYSGSVVPVFLPGAVSRSNIYSALAACAVGLTFGLNLVEVSQALHDFVSPAGRMKIINGINNTLIIDDTYNSSPKAVIAALKAIQDIQIRPGARRWIILADMLELGRNSQEEHEKIGREIAGFNFDYLITLGPESRHIAVGAKKMGPEKIKTFEQQSELISFLKQEIKSGDIALIKGSQGMRMEHVVKALMVEPQKAKLLLVRQSEEWE